MFLHSQGRNRSWHTKQEHIGWWRYPPDMGLVDLLIPQIQKVRIRDPTPRHAHGGLPGTWPLAQSRRLALPVSLVAQLDVFCDTVHEVVWKHTGQVMEFLMRCWQSAPVPSRISQECYFKIAEMAWEIHYAVDQPSHCRFDIRNY